MLKMLVERGNLKQYVLKPEFNFRRKETKLVLVHVDIKMNITTILATLYKPLSIPGKQRLMPKIIVVGIQYSFIASNILPINGLITFFEAALNLVAKPHEGTLVLPLEI